MNTKNETLPVGEQTTANMESRLADLVLKHGTHESRDDGICAIEALRGALAITPETLFGKKE